MKKWLCSFILVAILLNMLPLVSSAAITPGKPVYGSASGYGSNFTLTGNLANDVIAVAEAQVYKSGSKLGYSSAWCDAFVIDCARIANVPTSVIPNTRGCKALYDAIINKGGTKVTTPQAGDVVLYYCKTCKNYPHIGFYAGSGYTCEGNVGGSVSNSNRKNMYYVDGSGHSSASIVQSLYVRPAYTNATVHTLNYNANGGSGTMASGRVVNNSDFTLSKNAFTKTGYTFTGWHAKRSDGKWYCPGNGWKTDSEIAANGYTKKLYEDAWSGTFSTSWTTGTTGAISVTFYAVWEAKTYNAHLYGNYSGKNYMRFTDFKTLNTFNYSSRDTSVYTLSVDSGRTADYGALKIVGTAAGSTSSDLTWRTSTMGNVANDDCAGDYKTMTLSFWAKSSVDGAKFYTRFGYQSADYLKSVTLTTDWQYYMLTFRKDATCGANFHPYFDKAGTFWISELQLEDGNTATAFVPEAGNYSYITATMGQTYADLPTPEREGYTFKGWYTAAGSGTKVDTDTSVMVGNICLYAQWQPNHAAISYHVNGGTCVSDTYSVADDIITVTETGEPFILDMYYNTTFKYGLSNAGTFGLQRDGYIFKGWSASPNSGTVYDPNDVTVVPESFAPALASGDQEVTLYAVWEAATTTDPDAYLTVTLETVEHVGAVAAGEEITFDLTASAVEDINALDMRLCFDDTRFAFVSGEFKGALSGFDVKAFNGSPSATETDGAEVWMTAAKTSGSATLSEGEVIASVTLRALTDITADEAVNAYRCEVTSKASLTDGYDLTTAWINGGVVIVDYPNGDINRDGRVSLTDAMRAFYAVNGQIVLDTEEAALADVDGDGEVDIQDAMRIFYCVNGVIDSL